MPTPTTATSKRFMMAPPKHHAANLPRAPTHRGALRPAWVDPRGARSSADFVHVQVELRRIAEDAQRQCVRAGAKVISDVEDRVRVVGREGRMQAETVHGHGDAVQVKRVHTAITG